MDKRDLKSVEAILWGIFFMISLGCGILALIAGTMLYLVQ